MPIEKACERYDEEKLLMLDVLLKSLWCQMKVNIPIERVKNDKTMYSIHSIEKSFSSKFVSFVD